jgi:hypothetical protein
MEMPSVPTDALALESLRAFFRCDVAAGSCRLTYNAPEMRAHLVSENLHVGRAGALLLTIFGSVSAASAQPSSTRGSTTTAESLFEEGRHLVERRQFAAACPKLAASKELEAGIGVGLWLADCLESNGQTASAWQEFMETAALAASHGDPRESVAHARAAALLPRLSRIVLEAPSALPDAVAIVCDGAPVPRTRWSSGFYVDPGLHHLLATQAGRAYWEADVSVSSPAGVESLTLPAPPPPGLPATIPSPSAREQPRPPDAPGEASRTGGKSVAIATVGTGLVSIGLGAFFGLTAKHDNDASQGGCGSEFCSPPAHDLRESALHNATAADVAFGIGAAAVVGGVLLYYIFSKDHDAAPSARIRLGGIGLEAPF